MSAKSPLSPCGSLSPAIMLTTNRPTHEPAVSVQFPELVTLMTSFRFAALVPLATALLFLIGCKPEAKRYGVSGVVKYKGEPVKFGTISFRSDDGQTGGAQVVDGKYEIPAATGLPPGKYQVAVTYPDPKAPKPKEGEPPGVVAEVKDLLPDKYNNKTELTAEIKAESNNVVNFDLK